MLQPAEESYTRYAEISNNLLADDGKLLLRFYMRPRQNAKRTADEGRPIFEEVLYIKIMSPGDALNIIDREFWVDPENPNSDSNRFSRAYALWKEKGAKAEMGTPLVQWPLIDKARVEELAYFKITTVEALSIVSDEVCQRFMGLQELRRKAKDYLAAAKGEAPLVQMRDELTRRDGEIDTLKKQLAEQSKQIEKLSKRL